MHLHTNCSGYPSLFHSVNKHIFIALPMVMHYFCFPTLEQDVEKGMEKKKPTVIDESSLSILMCQQPEISADNLL